MFDLPLGENQGEGRRARGGFRAPRCDALGLLARRIIRRPGSRGSAIAIACRQAVVAHRPLVGRSHRFRDSVETENSSSAQRPPGRFQGALRCRTQSARASCRRRRVRPPRRERRPARAAGAHRHPGAGALDPDGSGGIGPRRRIAGPADRPEATHAFGDAGAGRGARDDGGWNSARRVGRIHPASRRDATRRTDAASGIRRTKSGSQIAKQNSRKTRRPCTKQGGRTAPKSAGPTAGHR